MRGSRAESHSHFWILWGSRMSLEVGLLRDAFWGCLRRFSCAVICETAAFSCAAYFLRVFEKVPESAYGLNTAEV